MPKTAIEMSEILQVRVSSAALEKIKKVAREQQTTVSALVRSSIYKTVGVIR